MDKKQILFGTGLQEIRRLIVTPITAIYSSFQSELEFRGWWNTKYFGKDTAIVKSPTGTHSADTVYFSAPGIESVIFLGYCGGVKDSVSIGDIIQIDYANDGINILDSSTGKHFFNKGSAYKVDNLYQQESPFFFDRIANTDCVDMETYEIYKASMISGVKSYFSACVVTDHLKKKPFYMVDREDMKKVSRSVNEMVETIKNAI